MHVVRPSATASTPEHTALCHGFIQVQSSGAEDARDRLLLAAARWVAHVPFLDDASLGKKRSNVWASNADFVAMSAGDHEEHAHLLAGCFLELGQEVRQPLGLGFRYDGGRTTRAIMTEHAAIVTEGLKDCLLWMPHLFCLTLWEHQSQSTYV
eukprot:GHUV01057738.1.p2 GENE.GHUV01057738.1~~GHUV01057738.1.p2  ORF type:complete len:153 (+),score=28.02 GHUV01057738.1:980-1438(+)